MWFISAHAMEMYTEKIKWIRPPIHLFKFYKAFLTFIAKWVDWVLVNTSKLFDIPLLDIFADWRTPNIIAITSILFALSLKEIESIGVS